MKKGPSQISRVMLQSISSEDEKQINNKELIFAFKSALAKYFAQEEHLKAWNIKASKKDENDFMVEKGNNKFQVRFLQDGLVLDINSLDKESTEAVIATMLCYQDIHNQHHPKANLEFILTCNNEQEARKIIEQAYKNNINITSLKFYPDAKDSNNPMSDKPTNQKALLERIKQALVDASPVRTPGGSKIKGN